MSFVVEGSVPNMDSKNMLNYCIKTKAHETFVHLREYKVRCQQCNQPFVTNFALKEHIRAAHENSKEFYCSLCDKHFGSAGVLRQHKNVRNKKLPM